MKELSESINIQGFSTANQINEISMAITKALSGRSTKWISSSRIVASFAVSDAIKNGVRCRITPVNENQDWEILIAPKNL